MAREKIDIGSFGIKEMRPCRAITGVLLFEVRSKGNSVKADALVGKLREVMVLRGDVKVFCPPKRSRCKSPG